MICPELHSNSIVFEADKKTMTEELKMDIFLCFDDEQFVSNKFWVCSIMG